MRGNPGGYLDQAVEVAEAGRRIETKGADALRDDVEGAPQLGVLLFEQSVQRSELRAFDVPVIAVGLQIGGMGVGEQLGQQAGDLAALFRRQGWIVGHNGCKAPSVSDGEWPVLGCPARSVDPLM